MYAKLGYVGTQRHERHMVVLEAVVQSLVNVSVEIGQWLKLPINLESFLQG